LKIAFRPNLPRLDELTGLKRELTAKLVKMAMFSSMDVCLFEEVK